ncbi:MAG: glycosyltransferase [Prevotellaceae bacterium]|nr:glycosyltransferase [Prevotellaceae bacterium]
MRIGIYTTDLFHGREHLMPWRTVIEISRRLGQKGHDVIIINGGVENVSLEGINVVTVNKGYPSLLSFAKERQLDALFVEMKWREALKSLKAFKALPCKKIAYFTGGVYDLQSVFCLKRYASFSDVKPYLLECLSPKCLLGIKLKDAGFNHCIGLTRKTAVICKIATKIDTACIYPGKDLFDKLKPDYTIIDKYGLKGQKYICFTGAPAPTRGAEMLLEAICRNKMSNAKFVFLMRKDVGSNFNKITNYTKRIPEEKLIIIEDRLSREQLKAFFSSAWYMVLPFIIIPSEVPLTYFEIMQCGTPIITFENGGSSDYLREGMFISPKNISGMVNTLSLAWENSSLRKEKKRAAIRIMQNHPTWDEVTSEWENQIIND